MSDAYQLHHASNLCRPLRRCTVYLDGLYIATYYHKALYSLLTKIIKLSNYIQSIGQAKVSMFLSLLRQVILLIPCLIVLPRVGGLGLMGVWLAGPVAGGLASIITGVVFFGSLRKLKENKVNECDKEMASLHQESPLKV